jgi:NAD(P)-dependent dehydrogenase (short-subunit alcohol dehydrogenase family)
MSYREDAMDFTGKVALITGGTAGIGEATVHRISRTGASVVFVGRDEENGRLIESELNDEGRDAFFLRADLSVPEEVHQVVSESMRVFGRLDYAFNNAGISGPNKPLVEQSEANFDEVFQVNVKSLFLIMQQEIRQMLHQGWGGSIVNMASVGSVLATPGASVYAASKHAVIGLTKSAAIEYGPQGIRVNAVSPGSIRTEMLRAAFGGDEAIDRMVAIHPVRRIGIPDDVADAVAWLFSDQSSYYTGQSLVLDGGLTAQRPTAQIRKSDSADRQERGTQSSHSDLVRQ